MTTADTAWVSSSSMPSGKSKAQWVDPKPLHWDYAQFGKVKIQPVQPDETIEMLIVKRKAAVDGFNQ
ncbi:MAG: hypothetical protein NVS3B5_17670 [Sphingomicrobium sp.]